MDENNQKPPSLLQKIVRVFFLYFKKLLAFIKRPAVRILIFVLIGLLTALNFADP